MVAAAPKPKDRPFPEELVPLGSALQSACRSAGDVASALGDFCNVAFTNRDLALAGASFLLATFVKDLRRLGDLMGPRHLADEFCAGSTALCSMVSAYWDRKGETAKLAALAEEILSRQLPCDRHEPQLAEFIAALAAALAIPHPRLAEVLLGLIEEGTFKSEDVQFYEEVQEWQRTGQLLEKSSAEEKSFWLQEVRKRRRNWFWDTEEGRDAIRKLEKANPSVAGSASMIHRVVPDWAWDHANGNAESKVADSPPFPPDSALSSCESEASPEAPEPDAKTMQRKASAIGAVLLGAVGILLLAAALALLDVPAGEPQILENSLDKTQAVATSVSLSTGSNSEAVASGEPTPALSNAAVARLEEATPPAGETPVQMAQLVPVELTSRPGWVRSPLGLEFQVTETNACEGRVTDPAGKLWSLPLDPAVMGEVVGEREIVIPYSGDTVRLAEDQWQAGNSVPWARTGWTFKLPDPLPTAVLDTPKTADELTTEAPAEPADPAATAAAKVEDQTPAPPATLAAQTGTNGEDSGGSKPSGIDYIDGDAGSLEARLHPDYARQRVKKGLVQPAKSRTAPASRPVAKSNLKAASPAPDSKSAAGTQLRSSFVTRANNIRMTYKEGYWESRPGAYLNSQVTTPERWARDMTLRERSSGTIPQGYAFAVTSDGTVRVVPEGSKP